MSILNAASSAQTIADASSQNTQNNIIKNPQSRAAQSSNEFIKLLMEHRYAILDVKLNSLQQGYKAGKIEDYMLEEAFNVFRLADPAMEPSLNAWINAFPHSYAAHAARGIYYFGMGQDVRGAEYVNKTTPQQIAGLNTAIAKARIDLNASLLLDNKPLISYTYLLKMAKYGPDDLDLNLGNAVGFEYQGATRHNESHRLLTQRDLLNAANRIAPHNFIARHSYLYNLQTRWGGSTQIMKDFVHESKSAGLTADELGFFEALVLTDQAWVEDRNGQFEVSAADYAKAIDQFGAYINKFYPVVYTETIDATAFEFQKIKQYDLAFKYFQKAVEVNPKDAYAWSSLGFYFNQRHDQKSAAIADHIAADLGNADAQNDWGKDLWFGLGVKQDRAGAINYFALSAAQGVADAQTNLACARKEMGGR